MKLSLIIPCFNEEKNLPLLIERCENVFSSTGHEVILVENGSTDNTYKVLPRLLSKHKNIRCVTVKKNQGYGFGILEGLKNAKGDILSWTHADMQTDPADTLKGLSFFMDSDTPELLFVKGMRRGRPIMDVIFTVGMSIFESILLRKIFWDINAQPTMFHRSMLNKWSNPPHDFSLDLYSYYYANIYRYKIKRFPVIFGERAHGISHWNVDFKSKIKFISRTIEFSFSLKKRLGKNANYTT